MKKDTAYQKGAKEMRAYIIFCMQHQTTGNAFLDLGNFYEGLMAYEKGKKDGICNSSGLNFEEFCEFYDNRTGKVKIKSAAEIYAEREGRDVERIIETVKGMVPKDALTYS